MLRAAVAAPHSIPAWSQPRLRSSTETLARTLLALTFRSPSSFRLNVSWALGLKDTNGETLEESFSCTGRTAASNRTMKISASIATTPGLSRFNKRRISGSS